MGVIIHFPGKKTDPTEDPKTRVRRILEEAFDDVLGGESWRHNPNLSDRERAIREILCCTAGTAGDAENN